MKRKITEAYQFLSSGHLTSLLDDLVRKQFKKKHGDNPACIVCGARKGWYHPLTNKQGIQLGHYIARQHLFLRWDEDNLYPQCNLCNIAHNTNPDPFKQAIINTCGEERIKTLNTRFKDNAKTRFSRRRKINLVSYFLKKDSK